MPVEFTRTEILLVATIYIVAIFAVYYEYSIDVRPKTSKKVVYGDRNTANDPADSSIEKFELQPNDVGPDRSSRKIVANSTEKDYETNSTPPEIARLKDIFRTITSLMDTLNLRNKTAAQVREELYVDFSTLDTRTFPQDEKMRARLLLHIYGDALLPSKMRAPLERLHPSDRSKYDLRKLNDGIVALGVENFMKAATQFCEEEAAARDIPIISIGSGDGTIEKEIIAQYRERFGKEIRIQLINWHLTFNGIVDFKAVDHLIAENPSIVGNCVTLIIWPSPTITNVMKEDVENNFDLEAVQKLQPKAALIVYESTGMSGSRDFRAFLREDSEDDIPAEAFGVYNWLDRFFFSKKESYGLDNYVVLEVARQKVIRSRAGTMIFRMVKIVRTN